MATHPGGNGEVCARTWPGRWRQRCAGNVGEERGGGARRDEDFETEHEANFVARVDQGRAGLWASDGGCPPDAGSNQRAGRAVSVWGSGAEAGLCGAEDTAGVSGLRSAAGDGTRPVATDKD